MAGTKQSGGRNAKGTQAHILRGTFRGDRHADPTSSPPAGVPMRPKGLAKAALAEWDRMVARLTHTGALSAVDDGALYQYVQLFAETEAIAAEGAEHRRLTKLLLCAVTKLEGDALVEAVKQIVTLQALAKKTTQQLRQGHMALRQYLVEFGMTPSARSRVKLPAVKPAIDPNKERYFGSGR